MQTNEANIKLTRNGGKVASISVQMPIWSKVSDHGNLLIDLPFLGISTIAKNEEDSEKAIEEAIVSFCLISDKFGQGVEKELETLGWIPVNSENGEPLLGYSVDNADELLERILQTSEPYAKEKLEITNPIHVCA